MKSFMLHLPAHICTYPRLVERYLLDNYKPHQLSTYALTLYRYDFSNNDGKVVPIGEPLPPQRRGSFTRLSSAA